MENNQRETIVVGGGVGGLAAAALLAQAGHEVMVLEGSATLGGRARTDDADGFDLNLGAHALYRTGHARAVLDRLGIAVAGGRPTGKGGYLLKRGQTHTFPAGPVSMLTSGALTLPGKLELARLLASLGRLDPTPLEETSVRAWLDATSGRQEVRDVVEALVRLTTYVNAPGQLSAAVAVRQLKLGVLGGVDYLDGGWRSLVEALRDAAVKAGATIQTGQRAKSVAPEAGALAVTTGDGTVWQARHVVLAVAPKVASRLTRAWPHAALHERAAALTPVRASCLDVGLDALPRPANLLALGVDKPLYVSVHSAYAKLRRSERGDVVHVAKYLGPNEAPASRQELERALDALQPGWREHRVVDRFRPSMVVAHALPRVAAKDMRPESAMPDIPGVLLVGDWVGRDGFLADASLASASVASRAIVEGERAAA